MATGGKTLLLLGDSLIEYGDWHNLLPGYIPVNRGMAGETVGDLSVRLAMEIDNAPAPDHVVIFSGTNNILLGDQSFSAVFATMLPRLAWLVPEAEITVIGIAPMRLPWIKEEQLAAINRTFAVTVLAAGSHFLDLTPSFALHCRPIGNPCFLADGVHFSPQGYHILAQAVLEHLESIS